MSKYLNETGCVRYFGHDTKISMEDRKQIYDLASEISKSDQEQKRLDEEDILQEKVFISPMWMMDVIRGIVRADWSFLLRNVLADHSQSSLGLTAQKQSDLGIMLRKLVVQGILHRYVRNCRSQRVCLSVGVGCTRT